MTGASSVVLPLVSPNTMDPIPKVTVTAPIRSSRASFRVARDEQPTSDEDDDRDGHVDEQDPSPTYVRGQHPAQQQPYD